MADAGSGDGLSDSPTPSGEPQPKPETWTYIGWRTADRVTGELQMEWLDPDGQVRFFSSSRGIPHFTVGAKYEIPIIRRADGRLTAHLGRTRFIDREADDRTLGWQLEDRAAVALAARIRLAKKKADQDIEEALKTITALYHASRRWEERQAFLATVIEVITTGKSQHRKEVSR